VEASVVDWSMGSALRFALRPRDKGSFLGVVSLENLNKTHLSADLGYWLHVDWTGQGLMREALVRIITFSFDSLGLHRIRVAAALENTKSRRLIESLGFVEEGISRQAERIQGRWLSHINYSLLATDPRPLIFDGGKQ
jgi:ribosomal-protein-serine acetyltransferase